MTDKEIENAIIEMKKNQIEHIERNNRLVEIKKKIKSKEIELTPLWHINLRDIDLTKQRECLDKHNSPEDYILIPSAQFSVLFSKMPPCLVKLFNKKTLFTEDWMDWKNSEVIYCWENGIKLIPPTIILMDSNQVFPAEGKHRINVANYFNATEIPILLPKETSENILKLLGMA